MICISCMEVIKVELEFVDEVVEIMRWYYIF
jgi:hypothetical protein